MAGGSRLWRSSLALVLGVLFSAIVVSPSAISSADSTDQQFLAALQHGTLCCPNQRDRPIPYASPAGIIKLAKGSATSMASAQAMGVSEYSLFNTMRFNMADTDLGGFSWSPFTAGSFITIAVHYYAPREVELRLKKRMGCYGGEAGYWYGPLANDCE